MARRGRLFSPVFWAINFQFALVTAIASLFFAFSGYLQFLGIAPGTAGLIISADALAALIVQPLIAPLVHAGTSRRWLGGGSLILAAALFLVGQAHSVPLLLATRLLQGAGFICVLSALVTMVVIHIPPEMSGRAFGWGIAMPLQAAVMFDISKPAARGLNQNLMIVMLQGGFFIGPFIAGQVIAVFGYGVLFPCLGALTLAASAMMAAVHPFDGKAKQLSKDVSKS